MTRLDIIALAAKKVCEKEAELDSPCEEQRFYDAQHIAIYEAKNVLAEIERMQFEDYELYKKRNFKLG